MRVSRPETERAQEREGGGDERAAEMARSLAASFMRWYLDERDPGRRRPPREEEELWMK